MLKCFIKMSALWHAVYARFPNSFRDKARPHYYRAREKLRFQLKIAWYIAKSLTMAQGVSGKLAMSRAAMDWIRLRNGRLVASRELSFRVGKLRFKLDASKHEIFPFWEIFCDADYELAPGFRAREDSVVVDVGANIGLYTMRQGSRAVYGRVLSFEPSPDTFRRLTSNIQLNGLNNVTLVNAAIGSEEGTVPFFIHAYSTRARVSKETVAGTVEVPCATLDAATQRYGFDQIDIMKIDTEGHERAVLAGAKLALSRTKRLVIEVHKNHDEEKRFVEDSLRPLGFRVVKSDRSLLYLARE